MGRRGKGLKSLRKRENNEICKKDYRMHCLKTGLGRFCGRVQRHLGNVDSHSFVKLDWLLSN